MNAGMVLRAISPGCNLAIIMDPELKSFLWAAAKTIGLPVLAWFAGRWFQRRPRAHLDGLIVRPQMAVCKLTPDEHSTPEEVQAGPIEVPALMFLFTNNTGKKLYIHHASVGWLCRGITPHAKAARDMGTATYELKFKQSTNPTFSAFETILQTGENLSTVLPLSANLQGCADFSRKTFYDRIRGRSNFTLCYSVTTEDATYRIQLHC